MNVPAPSLIALVCGLLIVADGRATALDAEGALARGNVVGQGATPIDPPAPTSTEDGATDEEIAAFIEDYLAGAVDSGGLPGVAVVVVRRGRVILERAYGVADYDERRPVLIDETLFHQASISKTFIWLLVLQLLEDGRLDLDRDVNAYLDFEIPAAFGEPITMRHLMTHTSGFADRWWGMESRNGSVAPFGQVLRQNVPERIFRPGSTVAYSNYGAALAAYVVERITGQAFDTLVTERLFRPVGMTRSTFSQPPPAALAASLATNYRPASREPMPFPVLAIPPAGTLAATPDDMGRYLAMLMRGGETDGGARVVPAAALEQAMTLQQPLAPGLMCGWGLGFAVFEHRGVRYAGHGGDSPSVVTDLVLLPDYDLGWSLSLNGRGTGGTTMRLRNALAHAVIERFVAAAAPAPDARGPSTAAELAGSYRSTIRVGHGPVRVAEPASLIDVAAGEDGTITVSDAGRSDGTLVRWLPAGPDRFVESETGAVLAAIRDDQGGISRFASCGVPPFAPIMQYERASLLAPPARWMFPLALLVLVLAALAPPVGWLLRKVRRLPRRDPSRAPARTTRAIARLSVWLLVATVVGWMVIYGLVSREAGLLFTLRAPTVALAILAMFSVPFAGAIVLDAVLAWRDPARTWPQRLGLPLVAVAAVTIAVLFFGFDLTSLSADY